MNDRLTPNRRRFFRNEFRDGRSFRAGASRLVCHTACDARTVDSRSGRSGRPGEKGEQHYAGYSDAIKLKF